VTFARYLKAAFANHWNLLALFGSAGFAVLSGVGDVVVPFILAAEAAYLGLLGTHPKFQSYVDAQAAKTARQQNSLVADKTLKEILASLPRESVQRFKQLRDRCLELRQIAMKLKNSDDAADGGHLEQFQTAGLDRLLWIYLRLLFTEYALGEFLKRTERRGIEAEIALLDERLKSLGAAAAGSPQEKMRATLQDNVQTCRNRLANYDKARDNFELVKLEIDRLENKIKSLSELAINRQEPDFISGQVDQVASSMLDAEKTMNDLQFATGLSTLDEAVPSLMERSSNNVAHRATQRQS
jgi:chemotaxis protein histidine kinase CheA